MSTVPNADDQRKAEVAALLVKHGADIYAYLLASVLSPHDAEDLFQEVCLAAISSAAQFQPGTNFRAWGRAIARHRLLKFVAKTGRRESALMPEILDQMELLAEEEESPEIDRRRRALRECLESMGGAARRVLDLRYGSLLDVPGVAEAIGKTVRATYILLNTARRALRRCAERKLTEAV